MAHFVEQHFNNNSNSLIPGYWQADNADWLIPCDTQEQAEFLEKHIGENNGECFFSGTRELNQAMKAA